jgi:hypothetical protein
MTTQHIGHNPDDNFDKPHEFELSEETRELMEKFISNPSYPAGPYQLSDQARIYGRLVAQESKTCSEVLGMYSKKSGVAYEDTAAKLAGDEALGPVRNEHDEAARQRVHEDMIANSYHIQSCIRQILHDDGLDAEALTKHGYKATLTFYGINAQFELPLLMYVTQQGIGGLFFELTEETQSFGKRIDGSIGDSFKFSHDIYFYPFLFRDDWRVRGKKKFNVNTEYSVPRASLLTEKLRLEKTPEDSVFFKLTDFPYPMAKHSHTICYMMAMQIAEQTLSSMPTHLDTERPPRQHEEHAAARNVLLNTITLGTSILTDWMVNVSNKDKPTTSITVETWKGGKRVAQRKYYSQR